MSRLSKIKKKISASIFSIFRLARFEFIRFINKCKPQLVTCRPQLATHRCSAVPSRTLQAIATAPLLIAATFIEGFTLVVVVYIETLFMFAASNFAVFVFIVDVGRIVEGDFVEVV